MKKSIIFCLIIFLASCKAYDVKQTEPITLKKGIEDIIEALNHAGDLNTTKYNGLVPSEFTVELNLTTSEKGTQNASLEIAPASVIPKIGAGWSAEVNNSSGNKLTIKFRSILFAKQDEFMSSRTPDSIVQFYQRLKDLNWNVVVK
jgi:hypothetical protein